MTPRRTDYQERKERVLGIVVDDYIHNSIPVSSGHIVERYHVDLSSASIRNILAELESDGLLTHPHTSAGRVPTEEGYRYYVDNLMNEISLLEEQKRFVKQEYDVERRNLEQVLEKTSKVISDLTHYTSIVTVEGRNNLIFCTGTQYIVEYPDYQDIKKIREMLVLLEQKEQLLQLINCQLRKKIDVFIGHELACRNVEDCSIAVSSYHLNDGMSGRLAVLGPKSMNYQRVISALDYVSEVMGELF